MTVSESDFKLLRDKGPLGQAFRAGALCEARCREETTALHRDLIDYVRALAEHHPEETSGWIARTAAKVFYEGDPQP